GAHEQAEDEADDDHEAVAVDRKAERGLDLAEHAFSERGRWAWDAIASKGRSPEPTRRDGIVTALRTNGRSRHERRSRRPTVDHGRFDVGATESSSRLDGTRASLTLRAPRRSAWKALRGPAILSPSVPGAVADPSGR